MSSTFEVASRGSEIFDTTSDPGPTRSYAVFERAPALARRIGKYDIIGLLGKGAMGAVYHAVDPLLERDVALKVMLPQAAEDPEQKQRFEREARAVARIVHPNVVTLFDLGYHTDGSPYIVMELLLGEDLLQALRGEYPLPLERKIEVVLEVLQGLRHAHAAGIIHRDIKPANVFLCEDGPVKIMDFGVAQFAALDMTSSGVVVGTANYMSPEQVLGEKVDGRSDLFSVGCMLYELVAGRPPFEGEGVVRTLYNIAHREPVIDLPGELAALRPILNKALAKDPDQRYASTQDFASDLRAVLAAPAPAASAMPAAAPVALPVPAKDLDPVPLLRLLRDAHAGRKSGHLHFTYGRERRSLTLLAGRLLHATSDVAGEHLGDVLVRYGLLGQADLHRALAIVLRERKRLGAVLTEMRLVEEARLMEAVALHVREVLSTMMERTDGTHAVSFEETSDALIDARLGSNVSTADVVLEAVRRIHDSALVQRALGDLRRVVAVSSGPLRPATDLTLNPTDGFVLSRIDGVFTADQVLSLVPLPRVDAERSLFGLLCAGVIDYAPEVARPRPTLPPVPQSPAPASPAPAPAAEAIPEIPAPREVPRAEDLRKTVLELYESIGSRDHFELLRVGRSASDEDIRGGWARLARLLHPDAWRNESLADLHHIRDAVFVRLTEAYKTLRDPGSRSRYARAHPARFVEPAPQTAAPPATGEATLGIQAEPSAELVPQGPSAAVIVHQAEVLLRQEKFWDAIQLLEPAIARAEGATRARAKVGLATAYMKNPNWMKRAEDLLLGVVRERPQHGETYRVLGRLYRAEGFPKRAASMFEKALEIEPGDAEAAEALATLDTEQTPRRRRTLRSLLA